MKYVVLAGFGLRILILILDMDKISNMNLIQKLFLGFFYEIFETIVTMFGC